MIRYLGAIYDLIIFISIDQNIPINIHYTELTIKHLMENTKLIGANSYTLDNYDVTVLPRTDKIVDIYLRDNFKMEIYEAKNFTLNKINVKAVEDALRRNRKDMFCSFQENNCDGQ
jgi:2C-methyl-D-erythritol 2,4-cyclodiphosphate synthase